MDTKQSIVYLETLKSLVVIDKTGFKVTLCKEYLNEIIALLQQGEKYRQMGEEVKKIIKDLDTKSALHFNYEDFISIMNKVEQKYFPEGI